MAIKTQNFDQTLFRGQYRKYDANGNKVYYNAGDVVEYEGKRYLATSRSTGYQPDLLKNWKKYDTATKFFVSEEEPQEAYEGDKWLYLNTGRVYTLVNDNNGNHWVEF